MIFLKLFGIFFAALCLIGGVRTLYDRHHNRKTSLYKNIFTEAAEWAFLCACLFGYLNNIILLNAQLPTSELTCRIIGVLFPPLGIYMGFV